MATTPIVRLPRPLPHQLPVLMSPARFKVVACGRRWGKTAVGLLKALRGHGPTRRCLRGAIDGGKIWWVAPTYLIANEIWRDLKRATKDAWLDKSEDEHRIELPGGGSVAVRSADRPDTLVAVGLDGLIIDEVGKVKEAAWKESLRPALADRQGWASLIGTPKGRNWFFDLFDLAPKRPGWGRWQRPTSDNPLVPPAELEQCRLEMGSIIYSQEIEAQFVSGIGLLFDREWFDLVGAAPREARRVRYWDKAATELGGAYSAGVLIAEAHGVYYIEDVVRGQWSSLQRNRVIRQTAELDEERHPGLVETWLEQEPGSGGKESAEISLRELAGYNAHAEPVSGAGDKVARARPLSAQAEARNVKICRGDWNAAYLDELSAFPQGRYKDQVDASSGAFNKLALRSRATWGPRTDRNQGIVATTWKE